MLTKKLIFIICIYKCKLLTMLLRIKKPVCDIHKSSKRADLFGIFFPPGELFYQINSDNEL